MIILLVIPAFTSGQMSSFPAQSEIPSVPDSPLMASNGDTYPISRFALSVNPLGFLTFGPVISMEVGLTGSLVVNANVRFPSLGLLTWVAEDEGEGLDELSGIGFAGGLIYFFGDNMGKPYVGGLIGYQKLDGLYAQDDQFEFTQITNAIQFIANGGYRFRFNGGFFINTGGYVGVESSKWEWEYTDSSVGSSDEITSGNDIGPFWMAEITLGFEF